MNQPMSDETEPKKNEVKAIVVLETCEDVVMEDASNKSIKK
jgi:hypothetical protein